MKRLSKNQDGATAIEYGLIAALVSLAAVGVMPFLSNEISLTFGQTGVELEEGRDRGTATYTPPAATGN